MARYCPAPLSPLQQAAFAFEERAKLYAHSSLGGSPLWYGFVLRDAFEAGARWQAQQDACGVPQRVAGAEQQSNEDTK